LRSGARGAHEVGMDDVAPKPRVEIHYCMQCNWMLRAAWLAQEILTTFAGEVGEVALVPGTGGVFEVRAGDDLVWERKRDGGFPQPKELKQRIRDAAFPGKDLGHAEGAKS